MILLIDSSTKRAGFGIANENGIVFEEELESGNNADTLTYFIKKALDKNGIEFKKIEYVSLSKGPGSFTGLRIGSAIAKGICFALGSELIEIPTLDIIANKAAYLSEQAGSGTGKITSLIFSNTRSQEFYYCEYELISCKLKRTSDYKTGLLEDIFKDEALTVINEEMSNDFDTEIKKKIKNVSELSKTDSQYRLTKEYIQKSIFTDYRKSEPFYMKEFAAVRN